MHVAQVTAWGSPPQYVSAPDLPEPSAGQLRVKVLAVGVPRVVQGRASGKHSSSARAALPFDPSVDGVVLDEAAGHAYYAGPMSAALFASHANVDRHQLVRLPPGSDPVAVAALVNPVSSSYMALRYRAVGGVEGRTVLVLGATGGSGRVAVAVARRLGAARVVGMSRSQDNLDTVQGLDERVLLREPFELPPTLGPVHIVLDFVGGNAASGVLQVAEAAPGEDLQYIHVGDLSGQPEIALSAKLLNMKPIRITGSGMGAWNKMDLKNGMAGLVDLTAGMERPRDVFTAPLSEVQSVWDTEDAKKKRLVLIP